MQCMRLSSGVAAHQQKALNKSLPSLPSTLLVSPSLPCPSNHVQIWCVPSETSSSRKISLEPDLDSAWWSRWPGHIALNPRCLHFEIWFNHPHHSIGMRTSPLHSHHLSITSWPWLRMAFGPLMWIAQLVWSLTGVGMAWASSCNNNTASAL